MVEPDAVLQVSDGVLDLGMAATVALSCLSTLPQHALLRWIRV